jgi:hypothetical protein
MYVWPGCFLAGRHLIYYFYVLGKEIAGRESETLVSPLEKAQAMSRTAGKSQRELYILNM